MPVSVVVVSHRSHEWLPLCLASVHDCDDLVVVDNGSPGGEVAEVARRAGARVVRLPVNVGFPAGANAGLAAARGDVIGLLNDDAMAEPGWLPASAAALEDPDVAAVAPKLVFALPHAEIRFDDEARRIGRDIRWFGRPIRSATVAGTDVLTRLVGPGIHRFENGVLDGQPGPWRWTSGRDSFYLALQPGWRAEDILLNGEPAPVLREVTLVNNAGSYLSTEGHVGDYAYLTPDDGTFDEPADRFGACGAAMVVRRDTVARLGAFAGRFFAYYEDVDWCWRAQLAGMRVRFVPAGVVRHVGGVTSGGPLAERVRNLAARNRLLCLARNAPLGVLRWQAGVVLRQPPVAGLRPSLARALPQALADRRRLCRHWSRTPADVWKQWAGVDEVWGPVPTQR
ncbi:MAG TPA: glycosyltransferase [Acidimicrobiales bacterium]|nr:glycosyltransferase [Acidimicrobiales bacterium]